MFISQLPMLHLGKPPQLQVRYRGCCDLVYSQRTHEVAPRRNSVLARQHQFGNVVELVNRPQQGAQYSEALPKLLQQVPRTSRDGLCFAALAIRNFSWHPVTAFTIRL